MGFVIHTNDCVTRLQKYAPKKLLRICFAISPPIFDVTIAALYASLCVAFRFMFKN